MKKITLGILAHVDAGKTTLSEAMLYSSGAIRKLGRVDHRDAFFDTDPQERDRGITIFSKQAEIKCGKDVFTLLDTPGHVDFSAETERVLQVLDYAVLVISGRDSVQSHTVTLWKLMARHNIPVFIFVNKMDLEDTDKERVLEKLQSSLDSRIVDFTAERDAKWLEEVAVCDEMLLESFLENGKLESSNIGKAISERRLFPCYFGSALKLDGVDMLLSGLSEFSMEDEYPELFGARIYKISRDHRGNRLTHMKITGGSLSTKDLIEYNSSESGTSPEKAEQIRKYSGEKYITCETAYAGDICAVTGLKNTYAGQGLGFEQNAPEPLMEAAMFYKVWIPEHLDIHDVFSKMKLIEEEDPQLKVVWDSSRQEICVMLMGDVQTDVLKDIIKRRFDFEIGFSEGTVAYRETVAEPVTGSGHFEPLRHYAEVRLLIEPGKRGSGIHLDTICSEDVLDRNWQRLIMTHLAEREHPGVLTGSPVTDVKITVLTGRAHIKHTEGGDFRQATYRALRQGLRKARCILLEPWYEFRLEIPADVAGRAMSDIQKMGGYFDEPYTCGGTAVLSGKAPVSEMKDYQMEVASYSRGYGYLSLNPCGYEPCHDQDEVVMRFGYDPDSDAENPSDSIFCSNGSGFSVKWDKVDEYMDTEDCEVPGIVKPERTGIFQVMHRAADLSYRNSREEEEELERIFERTYGRHEKRVRIPSREILPDKNKISIKPSRVLEEYLLVDGYNIIFAWDDLKELAAVNMDSARQALIEILANYQGYRKCHMIVVFDAYKIKNGERHLEHHDNVEVVYTREAETADMYIEKTAHEKSGEYHVRVATSDRLEQMIITGNGAFKVSADEFRKEINYADAEITRLIEEHNERNRRENRTSISIPKRK